MSSLEVDPDLDVDAVLQADLEASVAQHENSYISEQEKLYEQWSVDREVELENQLQLYQTEQRQLRLEEARRDLAAEEEKLFFFDNYENMEREKIRKFNEWRSTWPAFKSGIKMPEKEVVKDDYIPPTIRKGSRSQSTS